LTLDGRAIGLRGAAAELLDVKGRLRGEVPKFNLIIEEGPSEVFAGVRWKGSRFEVTRGVARAGEQAHKSSVAMPQEVSGLGHAALKGQKDQVGAAADAEFVQ